MKQNYLPTHFLLLFVLTIITFYTGELKANPNQHPAYLKFIENKGQWNPNVLFQANVPGQEIYTERQGFSFVFFDPAQVDAAAHCGLEHNGANPVCEHESNPYYESYNGNINVHAVKVRFLEANTNPVIEKQEVLSERYNYFIGNDPSKWASNIHPAKSLLYKQIYPGINLKVYSSHNNFKYDWIISPNVDPGQIQLNYTGQADICVKDGHLFLSTSVAEAVELSPFAYQIINGTTIPVVCKYHLQGNQVSFIFPEGYQKDIELVIDPVLVASTYSGSSSTVYGHSATYGQNDEIFGSGRAFGTGYPVTTGAYDVSFNGSTDASISRYSPDGSTLEYASYVGGSNEDLTCNLITNYNNEIILLVKTGSSNYPTLAGTIDNSLNGTSDFGVTILSEDGSTLIGSTFLGGSNEEGQLLSGWPGITYGLLGELMIDEDNNVYLAGYSNSNNFPVTPGAFQTTHGGGWDGVVVKMNPNLTNLIWSTYLGGTADDAALGIRIAENQSVFVCGGTSSINFPVTTGAYQTTSMITGSTSPDGFVTHLSANGTTNLATTFVNTNQSDIAFFIDFDRDNNVCLYGLTDGNFIITPGTYSNAGGKMFLMALNPELNTLLYSTRVGVTSMSINPTAFLVDNCNRIYAGGFTGNSGMPTTPDAWATVNGSGDFYFIVLEAEAAGLLYGTYFGSPTGSEHVDGGTCRYNDRGVVYQAVCTSAANFPTTPTAYENTNINSSWDLVVFKFDFEQAGVLAEATASPAAVGCIPYTVSFSNFSIDAMTYFWDFADGTTSTDVSPEHTFTTAGLYEVMMIAINPLSCNFADTIYLNVLAVNPAQVTSEFTYSQNTDCDIYQFNFNTDLDGLTHFWNFGDFTTSTEQNPAHIYSSPGTYEVMLIVSSTLGCFDPDTSYQTISFTADAVVALTDNLVTECAPLTFTFSNNSLNATTYTWNFSDGSPVSNETTPTHTFSNPGFYNVTLIADNPLACNLSDTAVVTLTVLPSTPLTASFTQILPPVCAPLTVQFEAATASNISDYFWDFGDGNTGNGASVSHTYSSTGDFTVSLTVSNPTGICILENTTTTTFTLLPGNEITAQFLPPLNGCAPLVVGLVAENTGATSYTWLIDNTTLQGQNASHVIDVPGNYPISLIATQTGACNIADTLTAFVEVYSYAIASFVSPEKILVNSPVTFTNSSTNAVAYNWDFGNGSTSSETNPTVEFSQVGSFTICLTALNAEDCNDEICLPITVLDDAKLGVPNAFSPNNDNINDIVYVEGRSNILSMEFRIFNRWGKLMFATNDPNQGWDGYYEDVLQENEIYVYTLEATLQSGEIVTRSGNIALLR